MIKVITLVNDLPNEGGVGRVVYSLQEEFNKSFRIQNEIVIIRYRDSYFMIFLKKLFKKKYLNQKAVIYHDKKTIMLKKSLFLAVLDRIFKKNFQDKNHLRIINNKIKAQEFDIIHGHFYSISGFFAKELAKKNNKKSVVTFHGSDTIHLTKKDENLINSFDKITFVSNFLKETIEQKITLKVSNKVIYNGIDKNIFQLKNKEENRQVIAYCGRLHSIKGVDHLKNIFAELFKIIPTAKFHIYGDGIEKENLQDFFKMNDVPVHFFGNLNIESLVNNLQNVKVLVVPSVQEGFSCVIPEAKSCGTYVVAANVGGIPEAMGNIGSLVDRDNKFETNMILEIERIWKQENIDVQSLSKENIYSWKDIAKQYEEMYRIIINNSN
ncbi:MAG: glycosyltransferase family 4 protein [Culicoidibacterales bacterium]